MKIVFWLGFFKPMPSNSPKAVVPLLGKGSTKDCRPNYATIFKINENRSFHIGHYSALRFYIEMIEDKGFKVTYLNYKGVLIQRPIMFTEAFSFSWAPVGSTLSRRFRQKKNQLRKKSEFGLRNKHLDFRTLYN